MVVVREFRIIMPLTVEEYRIGQLYMTANTQMLEAMQEDGAGVDLVENTAKVFDDMGAGIYARKIFHIDRRFPPWLRAIAPKSGCSLYEESKNCFPVTSTYVTLPLFAKFSMRIDSVHYADRGEQDNIHKLPPDVLKKRKVVFVDIAAQEEKKEDGKKMYEGDETDASKFVSKKTGRGPLLPGWQKTCEPVMCCYKLVTSEFDYWGLQHKVEEFMTNYEHGLFQNANRQLWCWADEWHGLTIRDVREYEEKIAERTNLISQIKEGKVTGQRIQDLPPIKPTFSSTKKPAPEGRNQADAGGLGAKEGGGDGSGLMQGGASTSDASGQRQDSVVAGHGGAKASGDAGGAGDEEADVEELSALLTARVPAFESVRRSERSIVDRLDRGGVVNGMDSPKERRVNGSGEAMGGTGEVGGGSVGAARSRKVVMGKGGRAIRDRGGQRLAEEGEEVCCIGGCGKYAQYQHADTGLRVCSIRCKFEALKRRGLERGGDLPSGWEQRKDGGGCTFFIDHTRCITQRQHPTKSNQPSGGGDTGFDFFATLQGKAVASPQ